MVELFAENVSKEVSPSLIWQMEVKAVTSNLCIVTYSLVTYRPWSNAVISRTVIVVLRVLISDLQHYPFWPTVLSIEPLVHCVVCLSVCLSVLCDVLYCGETVRPSEKLKE